MKILEQFLYLSCFDINEMLGPLQVTERLAVQNRCFLIFNLINFLI